MRHHKNISNGNENHRRYIYGRNTLGAIAVGLVLLLPSCKTSTDTEPSLTPDTINVTSPDTAHMGNFIIKTYNVHDTTLKTDDGIQKTLEYIQKLMSGKDVVLALQELRNVSKAEWLQEQLDACLDPEMCEWGMYPDGAGSSMPWIWNNERFEIVQDESLSLKLHNKRTPHNASGNLMTIKQKWITIVVLKDLKSNTKVAFIDVHLARDYQTIEGELNTKAPELLETYNDEMDIIEDYAKKYLDKGYTVAIAGDPNWNHNQKTIEGSPPDRLRKLGFTNIYHDKSIIDLTPDIQSTHHDEITDDDSGNIDAIYIANPKTPSQPFGFKIIWRKNHGTTSPSDHTAVSAGITAYPLG